MSNKNAITVVLDPETLRRIDGLAVSRSVERQRCSNRSEVVRDLVSAGLATVGQPGAK